MADAPLVYALSTLGDEEYLAVEEHAVSSDREAVDLLRRGEADLVVVYVDQAIASELKVVANVSFAYMCANAADPAIAHVEQARKPKAALLDVTLAGDIVRIFFWGIASEQRAPI